MVPTRKQMFESLIEDGNVYVTFAFDFKGTVVPKKLLEEQRRKKEPFLTFEYGMDMPKPIPDLELTELGISATLSFSQSPEKTFVPWGAIGAMKPKDAQFQAAWIIELPLPEGEETKVEEVQRGEPRKGLRLVP